MHNVVVFVIDSFAVVGEMDVLNVLIGFGDLEPGVRFEVEDQKSFVVTIECGQVRTVGGPVRKPHSIGAREIRDLSSLQVDELKVDLLLPTFDSTENDGVRIRGPDGIELAAVFYKKRFYRPTRCRHNVDPPGLVGLDRRKSDLLSIRRPVWLYDQKRSVRQLQGFAAVGAAAP